MIITEFCRNPNSTSKQSQLNATKKNFAPNFFLVKRYFLTKKSFDPKSFLTEKIFGKKFPLCALLLAEFMCKKL